jgi:hypothetical protein
MIRNSETKGSPKGEKNRKQINGKCNNVQVVLMKTNKKIIAAIPSSARS